MAIIEKIRKSARDINDKIFPYEKFNTACEQIGLRKYKKKRNPNEEEQQVKEEIEYITTQIGNYLNTIFNKNSIYLDQYNLYMNPDTGEIIARAIDLETNVQIYLSIGTNPQEIPFPQNSYYKGIFESGEILEHSSQYFGLYGYDRYFSFKQIEPKEIFGD